LPQNAEDWSHKGWYVDIEAFGDNLRYAKNFPIEAMAAQRWWSLCRDMESLNVD